MSDTITNKFSAYKELWQSSAHQHEETELGWLRKIRRAQFEKFLLTGFPSQRDEEWKYTCLDDLASHVFSLPTPSKSELSMEQIVKLYLPGPHHRLVFINGHYRSDLSKILELPRGVVMTNFATACKKFPDLVQSCLNQQPDSALLHLNTAFICDGIFIQLPPNTKLEFPIHVIYMNDGCLVNTAPIINVRNIISCEDNSSLTIFEDYQSSGPHPYFTNAVTQLRLGARADVAHYKLQHESSSAFHVAQQFINQSEKSKFFCHTYSIGSRLARENLTVDLEAVDATCNLQGLYLTRKSQHSDQHIRINHLTENTTSCAVYKGLVAEKSHAVFNGKILVTENARRTNACLRNQNLLLDPHATINTKPELEIYTDDVQCSHSATIGELDDEMLFYLRARGLDRANAEKMLTLAFAKQVIASVMIPSIAEKILQAAYTSFWQEKMGYEELMLS